MDPDPGGPKTCGSGSATMAHTYVKIFKSVFLFYSNIRLRNFLTNNFKGNIGAPQVSG
jgi:hypothetical protein